MPIFDVRDCDPLRDDSGGLKRIWPGLTRAVHRLKWPTFNGAMCLWHFCL
jgi:hypothetical protein